MKGVNMLNPAGFWVRILASLLDGIIIGYPLLSLATSLLGFGRKHRLQVLVIFSIQLLSLFYGLDIQLERKY